MNGRALSTDEDSKLNGRALSTDEDSKLNGFVIYRPSTIPIIYGEPVAEMSEWKLLITRMHDWVQGQHGKGVMIIHTGESLRKCLISNPDLPLYWIRYGTIYTFDPSYTLEQMNSKHKDKKIMEEYRILRKRYRHLVENKDITFHEFTGDDVIKKQMTDAFTKWKVNRSGLQKTLNPYHLFDFTSFRRWFYVMDQSQSNPVVSILLVNEVFQPEHGYSISNVFTLSNAPVGTSEYAVLQLMAKLKEENIHYLTFGPHITNACGSSYTPEYSLTNRLLLSSVHKILQESRQINATDQFRKKFIPIRQEPSYLLLTSKYLALDHLWSVFRATTYWAK